MVIEKIVDWIGKIFSNNKSVDDNKSIKPSNLTRGSWGTYLGIENYPYPMKMLNVYIPGYDTSNMKEYFSIRFTDVSAYYPIMHRTPIKYSDEIFFQSRGINEPSIKYYKYNYFGGDTYVCQFTHRMQRNFEDPEVNIIDEIIDENTFKDNFEPNNPEANAKINRADVNAV
jgi:hypothetical protein